MKYVLILLSIHNHIHSLLSGQSIDFPLLSDCARAEQRIQRLIKLRNSVMQSYKEYKIPTEWMLDVGIVSKVCSSKLPSGKVGSYVTFIAHSLNSNRLY